jgi:hypothetical protein
LVGVLLDVLHLIDLADNSFLVDHESDPLGKRPAGHEHAKGPGCFLVRIGEQREIQILLVAEALLVFKLIGADADDQRIELSKLLSAVAEAARLDRSAPSQRFGEEIKDDVLLPFQILEMKGFGILLVGQGLVDLRGGQLDIGSVLSLDNPFVAG